MNYGVWKIDEARFARDIRPSSPRNGKEFIVEDINIAHDYCRTLNAKWGFGRWCVKEIYLY